MTDKMQKLMGQYKHLIEVSDTHAYKWFDMVCNKYTPISIGQGNEVEALMFRVSYQEDNTFEIEIQWDNGKHKNESVKDTGPLGEIIRLYYCLDTPTSTIHQNPVEERCRRLQYLKHNRPDLVSKILAACYWMGEIIAEDLGADVQSKALKALKEKENDRIESFEGRQKYEKTKKVLAEKNGASIEDLLDHDEQEIVDALDAADSLFDDEDFLFQTEIYMLKDTLVCRSGNNDLTSMGTINEQLGMIKRDADRVFKHIAFNTTEQDKIEISNKRTLEMFVQMADLLVKISHDSSTYSSWIKWEYECRFRSVIQRIYKYLHDASK